MNKIEKHLVSNFGAILVGKLYNFRKKSFWKYLIASVLFSIGKPELFGNFYLTFIGIFLFLIVISLAVMILSAKIQEKKIKFDAIVELFEDKILINHLNKDLVEEKDWSWINKIVIIKEIIFFETNQYPPLIFNIPKKKITDEEIEFLENIAINIKK